MKTEEIAGEDDALMAAASALLNSLPGCLLLALFIINLDLSPCGQFQVDGEAGV